MTRESRPSISTIRHALVLSLACLSHAGWTAQSGGGAAAGARGSTPPGGSVSSPPANSAMRRAGGGTVSAQTPGGSAGGGMSTATNAMTLTSGNQGGQNGAAQRSPGRTGAQQPRSIDSNGLQRGNASPPQR